jgi:hypothetical protein
MLRDKENFRGNDCHASIVYIAVFVDMIFTLRCLSLVECDMGSRQRNVFVGRHADS